MLDGLNRPYTDKAVGEKALIGGQKIFDKQFPDFRRVPGNVFCGLQYEFAHNACHAALQQMRRAQTPMPIDKHIAHDAFDNVLRVVEHEALVASIRIVFVSRQHLLETIEMFDPGKAGIAPQSGLTNTHRDTLPA